MHGVSKRVQRTAWVYRDGRGRLGLVVRAWKLGKSYGLYCTCWKMVIDKKSIHKVRMSHFLTRTNVYAKHSDFYPNGSRPKVTFGFSEFNDL